MIDSGFPPPAQAGGPVPPAASAEPSCPAAVPGAGRPAGPALAPPASASGPASGAAISRAGAGASPAPSLADASLAHRAALRRQLLALLGDEPTGHPLPPELP